MEQQWAKKEGNWWKLWLFWLLIWFDCIWLSDYHVSSERPLQQVWMFAEKKFNFKFDIFNLCSRHNKEHHISLTWIWIEYNSIPNLLLLHSLSHQHWRFFQEIFSESSFGFFDSQGFAKILTTLKLIPELHKILAKVSSVLFLSLLGRVSFKKLLK